MDAATLQLSYCRVLALVDDRATATSAGAPFGDGRADPLPAVMARKGPLGGDAFLAFVRQVLVPALSPGLTVVMDNRSVHKVPGVREGIEAAGWPTCRPIRPTANPLEGAWSKVKAHLRKAAARSAPALLAALGEGLRRVTARDARGWARQCGYRFAPHPVG